MKTLKKIKDDYAISRGYSNWNNLIEFHLNEQVYEKENNIKMFSNRRLQNHIDAVMKTYAMECLKLASERLIWKEDKELLEDIKNENNIIK